MRTGELKVLLYSRFHYRFVEVRTSLAGKFGAFHLSHCPLKKEKKRK